MYIDYFLKFADEAEADGVLFEGEERQPRYAAIDIIGVIYKDEVALDGWHVNVRHTEESLDLAAFQVFPKTPSRGWA